ncbi:hypothetical protein [Lentibacillus sp. CBA3610]|uniref:hypothetical protein n=1 Tax=Lentibacillus sp. CBA3610 TaxID=2518176 RepID=UPI00350E37AB
MQCIYCRFHIFNSTNGLCDYLLIASIEPASVSDCTIFDADTGTPVIPAPTAETLGTVFSDFRIKAKCLQLSLCVYPEPYK